MNDKLILVRRNTVIDCYVQLLTSIGVPESTAYAACATILEAIIAYDTETAAHEKEQALG